MKSFLGSSGYDFVDPRDGKASNYADRVSYTPGFEAEATAIGALLGLGAESIGPLPAEQTVKTPPDVPAFDVQIMVGAGLARVAGGDLQHVAESHGGNFRPRPSSSSGSSTAKPGAIVATSNRMPPGSRK